jgi:hypothetical protein
MSQTDFTAERPTIGIHQAPTTESTSLRLAVLCLGVADLLHQNVAHVMPIRDEIERRTRFFFRGVEVRSCPIQIGPCQAT